MNNYDHLLTDPIHAIGLNSTSFKYFVDIMKRIFADNKSVSQRVEKVEELLQANINSDNFTEVLRMVLTFFIMFLHQNISFDEDNVFVQVMALKPLELIQVLMKDDNAPIEIIKTAPVELLQKVYETCPEPLQTDVRDFLRKHRPDIFKEKITSKKSLPKNVH